MKHEVETAAKQMGYIDRPTNQTDMIFVGLGILVGGLVGALSIHLGGIPISLSTSGGALIAGLLFGWLRSKHPTFGGIPEPSLWVLNNVGLNMFIAVVGIAAAFKFRHLLSRSRCKPLPCRSSSYYHPIDQWPVNGKILI